GYRYLGKITYTNLRPIESQAALMLPSLCNLLLCSAAHVSGLARSPLPCKLVVPSPSEDNIDYANNVSAPCGVFSTGALSAQAVLGRYREDVPQTATRKTGTGTGSDCLLSAKSLDELYATIGYVDKYMPRLGAGDDLCQEMEMKRGCEIRLRLRPRPQPRPRPELSDATAPVCLQAPPKPTKTKMKTKMKRGRSRTTKYLDVSRRPGGETPGSRQSGRNRTVGKPHIDSDTTRVRLGNPANSSAVGSSGARTRMRYTATTTPSSEPSSWSWSGSESESVGCLGRAAGRKMRASLGFNFNSDKLLGIVEESEGHLGPQSTSTSTSTGMHARAAAAEVEGGSPAASCTSLVPLPPDDSDRWSFVAPVHSNSTDIDAARLTDLQLCVFRLRAIACWAWRAIRDKVKMPDSEGAYEKRVLLDSREGREIVDRGVVVMPRWQL
ncbi:hypothetical protein H0H92_006452, partial [Tricholoma furcatifolium]